MVGHLQGKKGAVVLCLLLHSCHLFPRVHNYFFFLPRSGWRKEARRKGCILLSRHHCHLGQPSLAVDYSYGLSCGHPPPTITLTLTMTPFQIGHCRFNSCFSFNSHTVSLSHGHLLAAFLAKLKWLHAAYWPWGNTHASSESYSERAITSHHNVPLHVSSPACPPRLSISPGGTQIRAHCVTRHQKPHMRLPK